jgi:hypothetical protein
MLSMELPWLRSPGELRGRGSSQKVCIGRIRDDQDRPVVCQLYVLVPEYLTTAAAWQGHPLRRPPTVSAVVVTVLAFTNFKGGANIFRGRPQSSSIDIKLTLQFYVRNPLCTSFTCSPPLLWPTETPRTALRPPAASPRLLFQCSRRSSVNFSTTTPKSETFNHAQGLPPIPPTRGMGPGSTHRTHPRICRAASRSRNLDVLPCDEHHAANDLEANISTDDARETEAILIPDMSSNAKKPQGLDSPELQARRMRENAAQRARENLAAVTNEKARKEQEEREITDYLKKRTSDAKERGLEILVVDLQREIAHLNELIEDLKQQLKEADGKFAEKDEIIKQQNVRNLQQAATIKHQSALIQNPRTAIATPSNGRENMPPMTASYTAPPAQSRFAMSAKAQGTPSYGSNSQNGYGNGQALQQFGKSLTNRGYLNSAEQGSPGARRITAPQGYAHSRESSTSTNPYDTPSTQRYAASGQTSRPTTSSTQATAMSNMDNSMALVVTGDRRVIPGSVELTKAFEKLYNMVEKYARAHVNFVSNEKDGNMPQFVKQALLAAAAPANAFPFMGKPESRYHMVTKAIVIWINKEILKGTSFAGFNPEVNSIIEDIRNKMYQGIFSVMPPIPSDANRVLLGTPVVIKKMYLSDIASHVNKLLNAPGFKEFIHGTCRDKGNQIWKLVKPMMHQKTSNDWNDMYALMTDAHKLAIDMLLSGNEFTFEHVDIQTKFSSNIMINKDQSMMSIPGQDLAQRGAVVRLPITPKVLARAYDNGGNTHEGLVYRSTVLVKWSDVRQSWNGHHHN